MSKKPRAGPTTPNGVEAMKQETPLMEEARLKHVIEVLSGQIDNRDSYHHHKETMAWTATAFYVVGVIVLAHEGSHFLTSGWVAQLSLILAILIAFPLVWLFVQMQLSGRWSAAEQSIGLRRAQAKLTDYLLYGGNDPTIESATHSASAEHAGAPGDLYPKFVQAEIDKEKNRGKREHNFFRLNGRLLSDWSGLELRARSQLATQWVLVFSTFLAVCQPVARLVGFVASTSALSAASAPAYVAGSSSASASQPSPLPVETSSGWWTIVAVLVSVVAVLISIWSVHCVKRQNRISVGQRLIDRAFQINEGFLQHKVRSPYAYAANLDGDRALAYTANAVMLLQQLNLLRDVYQHRDILPATEVESYKRWARDIVAPWVNGNNDLRIAWAHVKKTTDLSGQEFVDWVSSLMSSVSLPSSTPVGGAGD
jgi:hypothetical protein